MIRRAVVFGAAGQLGVELMRELQVLGYTVTGWDRSEVDINDAQAIGVSGDCARAGSRRSAI